MPKMLFEGEGKHVMLYSEDEKIVIKIEGQVINLSPDEAEQMGGWLRHQLNLIRESQIKKLPKWKQLLKF